MSSIQRILGALALCAATVTAVNAQGATPSLVIRAFNVTAGTDADRGAARRDTLARMGDVLRYDLAFANSGDQPLRGVVVADPIPLGLHFVANSARASRGDARVEYSADGGRTWSTEPIENVMVDGRSITRPIAPDRYTHIRWSIVGTVAPHATVTAEFAARFAPATRDPVRSPTQ